VTPAPYIAVIGASQPTPEQERAAEEVGRGLGGAGAVVINGGGPMPAFGKEGLLSSEEVKAVATYVSSVAGTE